MDIQQETLNATATNASSCIHPDVFVCTATGFKPIKQCSRTSTVVTFTGALRKVREVMRADVDGTLTDVDGFKASPDHQLYVVTASGLNVPESVRRGMLGPEWRSMREIQSGDYVAKSIQTYEKDIPQLTEADCFIYGLSLSYGSLQGNIITVKGPLSESTLEKLKQAYLVGLTIGEEAVTFKLPVNRNLMFDQNDVRYFYGPLIHLPINKIKNILEGLRAGVSEPHGIGAAGVAAINWIRMRLGETSDDSFQHSGYHYQKIREVNHVPYQGQVVDIQVEGESNYNTAFGLSHNGGGKRAGSFAIYLSPWHADVLEFLELKKNHGDEEARARDLFYAMWVPDLFMKRVEKDETWSLMCPNICPGMSDVWGDDFERLYEKYETEGKFMRQIKARELWNRIMVAQIETGTPYLLFSDHVNRKSNQSNLGTIKSSNLCTEILEFSSPEEVAVCLAGETEIMTETGLTRIDKYQTQQVLVPFDDEVTKQRYGGRIDLTMTANLVDNGVSEVFEVDLGGTRAIKATADHRFLVQVGRNKNTKLNSYQWKKVSDLKENDQIVTPDPITLPAYAEIDILRDCDAEYLTAGWMIGDGWQLSSDSSTRNRYGVCFGKTETAARDLVVPMLDLWHSACPSAENGHDRPVSVFTNSVGTMHWQTSKQAFVTYIQERFGLMPHLGKDKVIPDILKYARSPRQQAAFLSGYFSADGSVYGNHGKIYVSLSSASQALLYDTQAVLRCFGIQSKVGFYKVAKRGTSQGTLNIHGQVNLKKFQTYINFMLCKEKRDQLESALKTTARKQQPTQKEWCPVRAIRPAGTAHVYDLSLPTAHTFIAAGVVTHNCNLASVSLKNFVKVDENSTSYDFQKLHDVIKVMTRNLNKVIDINFYPVPEAKTSNMRHRPIGIGVQGLADAFFLMRYPFDSDNAKQLNKDIFETMYHAALESSCEIAAERESDVLEYRQLASIQNRTKEIRKQMSAIQKRTLTFSEEELTREKYAGTYDSYLWNGGCPVSKGILQYDMWGVTPSDRWDWAALKEQIEAHGVRNSLLVAPMPTASTAQILGNCEAFEPLTSNIYARRTGVGEFIMVNKYLMGDLIDRGLWTEDMKSLIIAYDGSVQQIEQIPEELRKLYKTAWDIKQKVIIDMAADRGAFVDQSQSMNLFVAQPTAKLLTSMHFYSWREARLKTATYYLRVKSTARAQQFTIDPATLKSIEKTSKEEPVLACSRNNPDCAACGS